MAEATFEMRVEGLTGVSLSSTSAPTQDELTRFLNDGVKDLVSKILIMRPEEAYKFAIKMDARHQQSLSLGNMGLVNLIRGEFSNAINIININDA